MNELRMYVEHLFEGRVLTPENIELKEEIYGNLVARYEDLLAEGFSESEALSRTKDSITNIDDVIIDDAMTDSVDGRDEGIMGDPASDTEDSTENDQADQMPGASQGGPTPISDNAAVLHPQPDQSTPRKRKWPIVLGCVLVGLLVLGIGFAGCSLMFGIKALDRFEDRQTMSVEGVDGSTEGGSSLEGTKGGDDAATSPTKKNSEIFTDDNGRVWVDGEPGDELATEVVNADYAVVSEYPDTSLDDATRVEALLKSLPMGGYVEGVDVTRGVETLGFAYREVPEDLDGDSVDAALAYDVTALFCAMPLVNEIQVTLTESDEPLDESYYVFTRDDVQGRYGVRLDGELVNESGWHQLKDDNLYRRNFIERMVDAAEREWK